MKKTVISGLLAIMLALNFIGCDNENGTTKYTVTFYTNGGSSVSPITGISYGSTITLPSITTKEGYTFEGWYIDDNTFLKQFTTTIPVTQNITVFAKWTPYTIPLELWGTWVDQYDWNYTFTVNSFTGFDNGGTFTVVVSSYIPENNESFQIGTYPSGYKLIGKISSSTGRFVPSSDHTIVKDWDTSFYFNSEKNIIIEKGDNIPFVKQ